MWGKRMNDKRLIDARAFLKRLDEWKIEIEEFNIEFDEWLDLDKVISELEKFPAIDSKTLRPKASWKPVRPYSDIWFKCSHCGCKISTDWDYDNPDDMWNYCPTCGARMDADE